MALHDFTLSGPLVIDSTKMQKTMHHHSQQLSVIIAVTFISVASYRVK